MVVTHLAKRAARCAPPGLECIVGISAGGLFRSYWKLSSGERQQQVVTWLASGRGLRRCHLLYGVMHLAKRKSRKVPAAGTSGKAAHPLHRASHAPPRDREYLAGLSAGGKEKDKSIIGQYPPLHPLLSGDGRVLLTHAYTQRRKYRSNRFTNKGLY